MNNLKDIVKQIPQASTSDLQKLITAAEKELEFRKLRELVEYVPDVLDDNLRDEVMRDCDSLNLPDSLRKASSQWLSSMDEPYIYPDTNPVHHAIDIKQFPAICKVMDKFNVQFNATNDSCLILKYTTSSTSTSWHADDEENLDHSEPICNLTIGASRVIKFATKSGHKDLCSIDMRDKGVVVMKPGTQKLLLHAVRGDNNKSKTLRYSLSFRTLAKATPKPVPVVPLATPASTPAPVVCHAPATSATSSSQSDTTATPTRHVCLVAGDSYAARLDIEKLGKNRVVVENIAHGGARIHNVIGQLKAYAAANVNTTVDKVLVSVGTNDIRYQQYVGELRSKFKSLCSYINELFPCAKVYFQLLIPLPCKNNNDWVTNRKVIDFNRIIFNECIFRKVHTLDAFSAFRSPFYDFKLPKLRNDRLFNGADIHPSYSKGMGVLAKLYLIALHSKFFDPFILQ